MSVCLHGYVYIYIYTHTHTHIHKPNSKSKPICPSLMESMELTMMVNINKKKKNFRANLAKLVCRTNFTITKCIPHMLSVLQHVLAHHMFHHEEVVDITLSNGHMSSSGSLHSCYNTVKWSTDSFTTTMKTPF